MDRDESQTLTPTEEKQPMTDLSPDACLYLYLTAFWACIYILFAIGYWRNRESAPMNRQEVEDFFQLMERAVVADEKHNEIGEEIVAVAKKMMAPPHSPLPDGPKYLS